MSVADTEREHKKNTRVTRNEKRKITTSQLKHNNLAKCKAYTMHSTIRRLLKQEMGNQSNAWGIC